VALLLVTILWLVALAARIEFLEELLTPEKHTYGR